MHPLGRDGPSTRTLVRIFFTYAGLIAACYLVYLIRSIVLLVAVSAFLALAIGPAVSRLTRMRMPRAVAILTVYLAIVLAIVGVGLLIVPSMVSGVQSLARQAPHYVDDLRKNKTFRKYDNQYHLTAKLQKQASALPSQISSAAATLGNITVGVFSALANLITVLSITFCLLLDNGRLFRWCLDLMPSERARWAAGLSDQIYRAVSGYVIGNLAISLIAGTVTYVTLLIVNVPFALPLAVVMAFFDLIPLVGATIGAAIVAIVTLFVGFPTSTIVWVIVQLIYQNVENYVVAPIVYRRTVQVNALVTIIAALIGASLLGILGALVAIPVAGALQILAAELWIDRRKRLEALHAAATPVVATGGGHVSTGGGHVTTGGGHVTP